MFLKKEISPEKQNILNEQFEWRHTLVKSYDNGTLFVWRPSSSTNVCVIQKAKSLTVSIASQADMFPLAALAVNPSQRGSIAQVAMFLPSVASILFRNDGILLRIDWNQLGGLKIVSSNWCQIAKKYDEIILAWEENAYKCRTKKVGDLLNLSRTFRVIVLVIIHVRETSEINC